MGCRRRVGYIVFREGPAFRGVLGSGSGVGGYASDLLIDTPPLSLRDVAWAGACRHKSPEECAAATHLVFPYRGVFVRHVGRQDAVGEANQLVMFNAGEDYAISHPVDGGDAC